MSPSPRLHISFHLPPHFSDALYGKAAQKVLFYSFWVHFSLSCFPQLILIRYFSFQFIRSVMLDSLWPHESQHARPPCPSPTPGVHPNSCLLSWWCHPAILSSVFPFCSCPQSLPASGGLFQWVSSSHQVAKVLEFQLQHQSGQWTPRTDPL